MGTDTTTFAFVERSLTEMNYPASEIGPDTPLGESGLGLESLTVMEIATRISEAYDLTVSASDMVDFTSLTVAGLANWIDSQRE